MYQHAALAAGRWRAFSLCEQLGNIGSEIHRARLAETSSEQRFSAARDRALELFDLTLADPRWRTRIRELARAQEIAADALSGGREWNTSLASLEKYFDQFAIAARSAPVS
ncbi:hypothetical protein HY970_03220 [Candidatus Kaiserbacteria bacterium]|nr:hypothetical protein [Candidatus Kaiserbacteria bacterium]